MHVVISLYPTIAKMSGLSVVHEHAYLNDVVLEGNFTCKIVKGIFKQHRDRDCYIDYDSDSSESDEDEDENEHERYTLIITYQEIFPQNQRFPIVIPHGKPQKYTCSKTYRDKTKKEIWNEILADIANRVEEEEESKRYLLHQHT